MKKITTKPSDLTLQKIVERRTRLEPKAHDVWWASKSYSILGARFLTNGLKYSIAISFEGVGGVLMRLRIDGEMVYEVNSMQQKEGKIELHFNDRMVVDFLWDVAHSPKSFSFFTRNLSSHLRSDIGSSSAGGSDRTNFSSMGIDGGDYFYVHALEILGV